MVALRTLGSIRTGQAWRLACLDTIMWSFIYYAGRYVMIRAAIRQRLAAIRHRHRADCRTRTDVLLTGGLSVLDV